MYVALTNVDDTKATGPHSIPARVLRVWFMCFSQSDQTPVLSIHSFIIRTKGMQD